MGGPWSEGLWMRSCESSAAKTRPGCLLTPPLDSIEHLRDLRAFFGTTFKIKPVVASAPSCAPEAADLDNASKLGTAKAPVAEEYILSCVGTGYTNTAKKT